VRIKIDVDVTDDDIRQGVPEEPECCPIALAIKRQLHPDDKVGVDICEFGPLRDSAFATINGTDCQLPDEAREFIEQFDHDGPVFPFKFEFEVPV
jgi:hypothetical protein